MKKIGKFLFLLLLSGYIACEDPGTHSNGSDQTDTASQADPAGSANQDELPVPVRPDCQLAGNILEGNEFWADQENLIVTISAGPDTEDPTLGESHRIMTVYDGRNCEQVSRQVLPVNRSPDFPYYLSDITYNNLSKVIAIRGFDKIYIYDIENRKLSDPLSPAFLNERYLEDAQSGTIQRLEVWEKYLIGHAISMGVFVFDLTEPMQSNPVLPIAEYELEEGLRYHSLFLLKSLNDNDGYQAIIPSYDETAGDFTVNPLFEKPIAVSTSINPRFRDNRYLVLKELLGGSDSRPIAIDMVKMQQLDLPDEIAGKKDTEIIEWMKNN